MAVAFGSIGVVAGATPQAKATTIAVAHPSGIAANDVLLLQGWNSSPDPYTTPGTWTATQNPAASAADIQAAVFRKVAAGTESGTVTLGTATVATTVAGVMLRYTGGAYRASQSAIAPSASTTSAIPPAVPGATATDMVIAMYFWGDNAAQAANAVPTFTVTNLTSAGWTIRLQQGIAVNVATNWDTGVVIAEKIGQTAAAPTITANRSGGWNVVSVAISATTGPLGGQFLPFMAHHDERSDSGLWMPNGTRRRLRTGRSIIDLTPRQLVLPPRAA
jgi:hypothetical protein